MPFGVVVVMRGAELFRPVVEAMEALIDAYVKDGTPKSIFAARSSINNTLIKAKVGDSTASFDSRRQDAMGHTEEFTRLEALKIKLSAP